MSRSTLAQLEAARDRAEAELAAYLRGPFIADFTRAMTIHALASAAEQQHQNRGK